LTGEQTSYDVIFHRLAASEYLKARRWYARQGGEPLGERFCEEVDESRVMIVAVAHAARRPAYWVRRRPPSPDE
jgi:hypothetical protein